MTIPMFDSIDEKWPFYSILGIKRLIVDFISMKFIQFNWFCANQIHWRLFFYMVKWSNRSIKWRKNYIIAKWNILMEQKKVLIYYKRENFLKLFYYSQCHCSIRLEKWFTHPCKISGARLHDNSLTINMKIYQPVVNVHTYTRVLTDAQVTCKFAVCRS